MTVGLIGLGYWGKNILRNLHTLGVLSVACDASTCIVAERQKEFPGVRFVTDYRQVLTDPNIAAVAIATPAATHAKLAAEALRCGKDVFVEKPLALVMREAEELVALAAASGRILMVGHILRYHPAITTLAAMITRGELGRLRYLSSHRLNFGKLRTEENILWSFAPHDISSMLFLLGEDPVAVHAFGGAYVNHGVHDTTMMTLAFSNGVRAHIYVNWLHPYKEQRFVVVGTQAMAVFDDCSTEKLVVYDHRIDWDDRTPVAKRGSARVVALDVLEPLREELSHFVRCVETRAVPETDGVEGLRVLKVLVAAEEELRQQDENGSRGATGYGALHRTMTDELPTALQQGIG